MRFASFLDNSKVAQSAYASKNMATDVNCAVTNRENSTTQTSMQESLNNFRRMMGSSAMANIVSFYFIFLFL